MIAKNILFLGSFDPPTLAHLDLIVQARQVFTQVLVAVADNPAKRKLFSPQQRQQMLEVMTSSLANVAVHILEDSLQNWMEQHQVSLLMRGMRNASDFDRESELLMAHRRCHKLNTIFFLTEYRYISSSIVRELIAYRLPLQGYTTPEVEQLIYE